MNRINLTNEPVLVLTGPGLIEFHGRCAVRVNDPASTAYFTFERGDKWDVPADLTLHASSSEQLAYVVAVQYNAPTAT